MKRSSSRPAIRRPPRQLKLAAALAATWVVVAAFDVAAPPQGTGRTPGWIGSAHAASTAPALSPGDAVVIQASDGKHYHATVDRLYRERGVAMMAFGWQAGNRLGQGSMPLRGPGGQGQNPKWLTVEAARNKQLAIANDLASTEPQAAGSNGAGNARQALPSPGAAAASAAGEAVATTPASGPLAAAERKAALAAHATWRREVGVGPLAWSDPLATSAQAWAEQIRTTRSCRIDESAHSQRADIGENLAAYSPVRYSSGKTRPQAIDVTRVVNDWGREKRFYDHASNACSGVCGHYTQVVWQGTQAVGCGRAVCDDQSQVWVCQYSPPGNYTGQKPY